MEKENREKLDRYYIPENFMQRGSFMGIDSRNWVETAVAVFAIHKFLSLFAMDTTTAIVLNIILCGVTGLVFLIGIHDEPVSIYIKDLVLYHIRKRDYHFRRTGYVREKSGKKKRENGTHEEA